MTALHWAVQKGYFDVVHLLMQHGANASLPNKVQLMCLFSAGSHCESCIGIEIINLCTNRKLISFRVSD